MIVSHLTPVLALLMYLSAAFFPGPVSERQVTVSRLTVGLGILLHLYSLFIFYPIASSHLLAFTMSITSVFLAAYFLLSGGGQFKSFRQLILGFIILLYLCSSVLLHLGHPQNLNVKSAYLLWSHVGLSLVGCLSFLASGILGLAYISQAKALRPGNDAKGVKQIRLSSILGRLPPLRELSHLIKLSGKIGLFSGIIGLYFGFLYTESTGALLDFFAPKLLLPIILVIYYGLILVFRSKISETIFARLSATGVILTISSLVIASIR